ncbi:MAG TPA: PASTA domain-containing protein, partial [Pseudolysinimonas sp.]|nr:PASTA domain-containing protein [Pseudolysinimonas sp.]
IKPTGSGDDTPSATTQTRASRTPTPSDTPTPTPTFHVLNPADYKGKTLDQVSQMLSDLGYGVDPQNGTVADSPTKNNTVYGITPYGNQKVGTTITVNVYTDYPGATAPGTPNAPATATVGNPVQVTWNAYSGCPTDRALSGYTLTVSGVTVTGLNNPLPAGSTSVTITPTNAGTASITLTAICGSGSSAFNSATSNARTVTVL